MFHTLMTLATTATVVLHALLGCCVHHAHAGSSLGRCGETVTVSVEQHACAGHAHHSHQDIDAISGHACGGDFDHQPLPETPLVETLLVEIPDSEAPCSGSHESEEPCGEPDCLIVSGPRGSDLELVTLVLSSSLLTDGLWVSWRDVSALRTRLGAPPDLHGLASPLRIQYQVWRL